MKHSAQKIITALIFAIIATYIFFCLPVIYTSFALLLILATIILFEFPKLFSIKTVTFWLLILLYLILPFGLMIYLNATPTYRLLLFIMILMVFSHDVGAYITGNLFGKRKLAPSISPNKTWEGFFGGIFFTVTILALFTWFLQMTISGITIILLSIAVSTIATIGDLFESSLKRRVGIKDSGSLLPGHGGFLDRFDGVLPTVLFFFILKDYLVELFKIH